MTLADRAKEAVLQEDKPRLFSVEIVLNAAYQVNGDALRQIKPAPSNIVPLSEIDTNFEQRRAKRMEQHQESVRLYQVLIEETARVTSLAEQAKSNGSSFVSLGGTELVLVSAWILELAGTATPAKDFAGQTNLSPRQRIAISLDNALHK